VKAMRLRSLFLPVAAGATLLVMGRARADGTPPIDPEEIARRVVRNQRAMEKRWGGSTYDVIDVRTTYDREGRPKEIHRRLYYVLAGEGGHPDTRDLVEVDGRPPTAEEIREAAAEDAKQRERIEARKARRASPPPTTSDDDNDDPMFDDHRLSEVLGRYQLRFVAEEVAEGRPVYVVDFSPRPGLPVRSVVEKVFASMAGRAVIDAADLQVVSIEAHLTKSFKIGGGLVANVKDARMVYRAIRLAPDSWFPCRVDVDVNGKAILLFRIASEFRFEFGAPRSFHVEEEAVVGGPASRPHGSSLH
jgi:hypothetical protein